MSADSLTLAPSRESRARSTRTAGVHWLRFSVRWIFQAGGWIVWSGCVLAVLLRFMGKDSHPAFAPLFYATPLALTWSGLAATSLLFFALGKSRTATVAAVMALGCWGWWQQSYGMASGDIVESPPVRMTFWNAARLHTGWSPVADEIHRLSAPIMGFVEAGPDLPSDRARWRREFPEHRCVFFGQGIVLLVQGEIIRTRRGDLADFCHFGRADLLVEGKPLTVWVVDIHSSPFYPREEALAKLAKLTGTPSRGGIVIMGDFNTPADSVHLRALRRDFRNAFEIAGEGPSETWPALVPVLAIDQVWANREVAIHRAWYAKSAESDHLAVLAELSLPE